VLPFVADWRSLSIGYQDFGGRPAEAPLPGRTGRPTHANVNPKFDMGFLTGKTPLPAAALGMPQAPFPFPPPHLLPHLPPHVRQQLEVCRANCSSNSLLRVVSASEGCSRTTLVAMAQEQFFRAQGPLLRPPERGPFRIPASVINPNVPQLHQGIHERVRRAKLVSEAIELLNPHLYDIGRQPPRAGPGGDVRRGGGAAGPRPADSRQAPPPRAAAPPPVEPPPPPSSLPKASIVISNLSSETLSSPSRLRGIFGEIGEIKVLPYLTTNNPHWCC